MSTPFCTGWCTSQGLHNCDLTICPSWFPLAAATTHVTNVAVALHPVPVLMQIAAALERIAAALESRSGETAE
jgi:hypothetical protein